MLTALPLLPCALQQAARGRIVQSQLKVMAGVLVGFALCTRVVVAEPPTYAVVVDAEPYGQLKDGQPVGAYVEIVRRLASEAGVGLSPVVMPFPRAIDVVSQGGHSITLMYANDTLDRSSRRLAVVTRVESVVLAASGQTFSSVKALASSRVLRLKGGCQDVAGVVGQQVFIDTDSLTDALRQLQERKAEGVCASRAALVHALRSGNSSIEHFGPVLTTGWRDVWLYASKSLPETSARRLRAAADALREKGELARIMREWGESP